MPDTLRVAEGVREEVGVARLVPVPVRDSVADSLGDAVTLGVSDGLGVADTLGDPEKLRVAVAEPVLERLGVCDGDRVGLGDGDGVGTWLGDSVPLGVSVPLRVPVCVRDADGDREPLRLGVWVIERERV